MQQHKDFMTLLWMAIGLTGFVACSFIFVACRDAAYRRSGLLPPKGQATMVDVERLLRDGKRILAIRCYRDIHPHISLAEAKKAVDELHISL